MSNVNSNGYDIGTLVLDEWYGLGIMIDVLDGKTGGYRNRVKFFYHKDHKTNDYNDREFSDLRRNYELATEKGKQYYAKNIQGQFNTPRK
jgi:hypothetical protein